jgi:hypothetical protein
MRKALAMVLKFCLITMLVGFSSTIFSSADLETTQATMIAILQQKNPAILDEFHKLRQKYYQLIFTFFDRNNNEPLKTHLNRMNIELQKFHKICDDPRFSSIRPMLHKHYSYMKHMINVLQNYVGSINSVSLAFAVREYKFLLPKVIKQKGDIALLLALHHRLTC